MPQSVSWQRARGLILVLLVLSAVGVMYCSQVPRSGREPAQPDLPGRSGLEAPGIPRSLEAERSVVTELNNLEWRIVNDIGEAIPAAQVALLDAVYGCDEHGKGAARVSRAEVPCKITAPHHRAWSGELSAKETNTVVLTRTGDVIVTVIDEVGNAVAGAEVWLSTAWEDGDAYDKKPGLPRARSDMDGFARLRDVPHGKWFVQARHAKLIYAHATTKDETRARVLRVGTGEHAATVIMSIPYVVGIKILGGEMFYSEFLGLGNGYCTPDNPDGLWGCNRIRSELEAAHPGAKMHVMVRRPSPQLDTGYGHYTAIAWMIGRAPWKQNLIPVPLEEFRGPALVSSEFIPESSEFGSILVNVEDVEGSMPTKMAFSIRASMADRRLRRGSPLVYEMKVDNGELVTLPVGSYDLICRDVVLSKIPDLNRHDIQVTRGGVVTVDLVVPGGMSRCRLTARRTGDLGEMLGGGLVVEQGGTDVKIVVMLDTLADGLECWLPAGVYASRFEAYDADPKKIWKGVRDGYQVGGGTLQTPQVIEHEMQLQWR